MILRDPLSMARIMRADKTIGELLTRLFLEVNDCALLSGELNDVAQVVGDLMRITLDKAEALDDRMRSIGAIQ